MQLIFKDFKRFSKLAVGLLFLWNCSSEQPTSQQLQGYALGTSYSLTYVSATLSKEDLTVEIDSLFQALNQSLSTYIPDSSISKINAGDSLLVVDEHFVNVYQKASEVWERSSGYFDPTVGALVNAYGFGPGKQLNQVSQKQRDSLLLITGWSKTKLSPQHRVQKKYPNMYFDFNAIAKGYAVDVLANFLKSKGVKSFLVEIGGEIVAQGKSPRSGQFWKIAIDDPQQGQERKFIRTVTLQNEALATSGNYRKYAIDEETGLRIAHSINPMTGMAIPSQVLSASVIAPDCMTADAYATALMVMPLEESKKLIEISPELEAYWIVSNPDLGLIEVFSSGFPKGD